MNTHRNVRSHGSSNPRTIDFPALLSANDVARILDISVWRFRQLTKTGELPTIHIGRRVLVKPDDLQRYIDSRRSE